LRRLRLTQNVTKEALQAQFDGVAYTADYIADFKQTKTDTYM